MAPRRTLLALALIALALTAGVQGAAKKADKKKGGKENVLTGALLLGAFVFSIGRADTRPPLRAFAWKLPAPAATCLSTHQSRPSGRSRKPASLIGRRF
jgi:hypothetical protein